MSSISRTNRAADHVSAAAEPAGSPLAKPIDAFVGSVPNGERGRSGSSHACSGISPTPDAMAAIACARLTAAAVLPWPSSHCPRSPASTGQTWPLPWLDGAHGWPSVDPSP